jgi:membrane-associated phospholipid phosphatase
MKYYTFVDYATQLYVVVTGVLLLLFHNQTVPHWLGLLAIHCVILVLVHALIQLHASSKPSRQAAPAVFGTPKEQCEIRRNLKPEILARLVDILRHFYPVLLYAWFYSETGLLNRMFVPQYLDAKVIPWEQSLFGCQPSILFMQKLPYFLVSEMFYAAYFSYYLMIGGVGLALFLGNRQRFFHYVSVVSFIFYICYLTFIVLPVVGPPIFFRHIEGYSLPTDLSGLASAAGFPEGIQRGFFFRLMGRIYDIFESPGAALPSSHVAVAVCTVYFSFKYLRPIRYWHLGLAILLCLATVYCRYHYVLDVLIGLLVAALLIPTGNRLFFSNFSSALDKS